MKMTDLGSLEIIGGQTEFRLTAVSLHCGTVRALKQCIAMVDILGLIPQF